MAYDDRFHCEVKTFHEAIGGEMVGGSPAEVDATYLGQTGKSWDSNWRPWSVVIVCGQPKRDIQPESGARDTVSAVMSGIGKASSQRVKRSTAVRQY
jgi:hypothetical protein